MVKLILCDLLKESNNLSRVIDNVKAASNNSTPKELFIYFQPEIDKINKNLGDFNEKINQLLESFKNLEDKVEREIILKNLQSPSSNNFIRGTQWEYAINGNEKIDNYKEILISLVKNRIETDDPDEILLLEQMLDTINKVSDGELEYLTLMFLMQNSSNVKEVFGNNLNGITNILCVFDGFFEKISRNPEKYKCKQSYYSKHLLSLGCIHSLGGFGVYPPNSTNFFISNYRDFFPSEKEVFEKLEKHTNIAEYWDKFDDNYLKITTAGLFLALLNLQTHYSEFAIEKDIFKTIIVI